MSLMDNELFVVSMIKSSERARSAVGAVLGHHARTDMLREILALSDPKDRLAELAARIEMEFTPKQLPTTFTVRHLRTLVRADAAQLLAAVLRCPTSEVLSTLLDAHQVADVLRDVGKQDMGADAEMLLLELMPHLSRLAAHYALGPQDWGGFLERRAWLTRHAQERLSDEARRRNWETDVSPTRILAGILDNVDSDEVPLDPAPRFDRLALIELWRRIMLLVEQLRGDAAKHADDASLLADGLSTVDRLPALIDLYERDAVATGLQRLLSGTISLADLLREHYSEPPPVTGNPVPDAPLIVRNDQTFGLLRRRKSFDIACRIQNPDQNQDDTPTILRCRVPEQKYEAIRAAVREIHGRDLSGVEGSLGERLLHTHVAQREGLPGYLRLMMHQHGPEVIPCVVLTGLDRPVTVPWPWHDYLATQLPYTRPSDADARFPQVDEVVRELQASVGQKKVEVLP